MSDQTTKRNTTQNPYIVGSPVKGETMFVGRDDIFEKIRTHLVGQHQDNPIVIQGQRRTGKTSVLYQMERKLNAQADEERYIAVLIDLQGSNLDSVAEFLWDLADTIHDRLRDPFGLPDLDDEAFGTNARRTFQYEFLPAIEKALGQRRLLLMFDEAMRFQEAVEQGKLSNEIFDYLRHLMQHRERVSFIFSIGSHLANITQEYNLLFNVALQLKVSFLEPKETTTLITQPIQDRYAISEDATQHIIKLTAGHAYYVQLLCHTIFRHWQQNQFTDVTPADIDGMLDEAITLVEAHLGFVWNECSPPEKLVLSALAEMAHKQVDLSLARYLKQANIQLERGEINRALQKLDRRELIARPKLHIELVALWLVKKKPLTIVREEVQPFIPLIPEPSEEVEQLKPISEPKWQFGYLFAGVIALLLCVAGYMFVVVPAPQVDQPTATLGTQATEADYQIGEVIKIGEYEERIELEDAPVNNCKSRSSATYTIQRVRTLEESVEITMTAGAVTGGLKDEARLAVGGEYGFEENTSRNLEYTVLQL